MGKNFSEYDGTEGAPSKETPFPSAGRPRRVFVKGMQRADVTVVVTVVQGTVWLSISPPFAWEAIMEPGKVDEVMRVLELAREEARKMAAAHSGRASTEGKAVVRAITNGT